MLEQLKSLLYNDLYSDTQNLAILFLSVPIYTVLIPLEIVVSNWGHHKWYSLKETLTNVYLNVVNAGIDTLFRGIALLILFFFYKHHLFTIQNAFLYWFLLFILEDVAFYFEHRVDHYCRFFWAVHVTHHSSEEYNLTTGFRSSVFMPFYRFIYFIPLALMGFHPIHIAFMYAITQTYGILVHTEAIKRMPAWFEVLFVSPSHHRVHHASNIIYLDKNMGMCLIIWDKLFGTFQEELSDEPVKYGLTKPLERAFHPTHIIFHEWKQLLKDAFQPGLRLKQRLAYFFNPPGWSHDGSTKTAKQLRAEL